MPDRELKAELEALKAQIAQMSRRVSGEEHSGIQADRSESSPLDEVRKLAERVDAPHLIEQASDYLKGLGQDVQDSKPRALVAAFVAGFLAGRVTGR
jgi:hypothetical protein